MSSFEFFHCETFCCTSLLKNIYVMQVFDHKDSIQSAVNFKKKRCILIMVVQCSMHFAYSA